jgi:hypothetical protein
LQTRATFSEPLPPARHFAVKFRRAQNRRDTQAPIPKKARGIQKKDTAVAARRESGRRARQRHSTSEKKDRAAKQMAGDILTNDERRSVMTASSARPASAQICCTSADEVRAMRHATTAGTTAMAAFA